LIDHRGRRLSPAPTRKRHRAGVERGVLAVERERRRREIGDRSVVEVDVGGRVREHAAARAGVWLHHGTGIAGVLCRATVSVTAALPAAAVSTATAAVSTAAGDRTAVMAAVRVAAAGARA